MAKVVLDLSMSLDGFTTGPNDSIDNGMGDGGERLHEWMFSGEASNIDVSVSILPGRESFRPAGNSAEVFDEMIMSTGAVVMGRRWFDFGEGPWGDNPPFRAPVFVVTHRPREKLTRGVSTFTFITDGLESALEQAKDAAGDKDVSVGGANIAQQCLRVGLLDEVQIHLVPVLLGGGRRLFENFGPGQIELERTRVVESPGVTHLRFRVVK